MQSVAQATSTVHASKMHNLDAVCAAVDKHVPHISQVTGTMRFTKSWSSVGTS
jgi:hypothetical protein